MPLKWKQITFSKRKKRLQASGKCLYNQINLIKGHKQNLKQVNKFRYQIFLRCSCNTTVLACRLLGLFCAISFEFVQGFGKFSFCTGKVSNL